MTTSTTMTEFTPARLAELRAVAEAAEPMMVFGGLAQTTFVSMEKSDVLALIDALEGLSTTNENLTAYARKAEAALEAKNAEVESLAKEALHALPDNRLGTLSSYITTLEQERDEARAEVDELRATLVELAPSAAIVLTEEVVIDGDVFTWGDLPDVLSRTGELLAEYRREAKDQCVKRRDAEAAIERAKALHAAVRYSKDMTACDHCYGPHDQSVEWPCPTIRALETGEEND